MRVLRIYHGAHRERELALEHLGIDVALVTPMNWPNPQRGQHGEAQRSYAVIELPVRRPGDVNRHAYLSVAELRAVIGDIRPDVLDIHEEPFSVAARQW